METQKIWNNFNNELYFFILKKVKNKEVSNDIFQNTFLKIHENLSQLKNDEKARAWVFQIARNEIANYFNKESVYVENLEDNKENEVEEYQNICCFDKFINDLPEIYKQVIELVYIQGKKQNDIATELDISLENVKARIKRAKDILKKNFNECCKYEFDKNGKLIGESNCSNCKP
ncbi:sigma-70 family RNA polymerase sigma factor [Kaistella flava (ex Peng et al. 2021)]|uniref:Sigma-70 family RNA polymerase sigma factor n=1 Tax=Kaistella flava (ex Peng et al. 2021) TaxID=2038776 RepID=A0A7M2Y674_9FLAO|nr:sigma-70 family RNA polymerase sigma factor [Kaistella flava (ex Peng et al. 2021)]QOW09590.1 sigma-70 family RNA polymerase sigma factor [Kaistella flava (ex Peng et al. 2021)]